jgi:hypothetical protein
VRRAGDKSSEACRFRRRVFDALAERPVAGPRRTAGAAHRPRPEGRHPEAPIGSLDAQHLPMDPHVVVQGERVPHVRCRVRRSHPPQPPEPPR